MVEVKDVTGVIAQVSGITTKEVTSKKDGKKYILYNIGLKLDDETWHNISGFNQAKAEEVLKSTDLNRVFEPGDQVKIYEESKDGQFWSIKAITALNKEPAPKESALKIEEIDLSDIEVDYSEPETAIKSEPKAVEKPEPKTVSDYKISEANKFSLGMAINCSAVLLGAEIRNNKDIKVNDLLPEAYPTLVKKLYQKNIELRKELLGY